MQTSLLVLALSGCFQVAAVIPPPTWQEDYATAWKKGHDEKKPLVVLVGAGAGGWQKLSKEGELGKDVKALLSDHYVTVYLDTTQEAARKYAQSFSLNGTTGIVISDRSGDLQAFRHQGELSNSDLTYYLQRFAEPNRTVATTETRVVTSYYQPTYAPAQPVNC